MQERYGLHIDVRDDGQSKPLTEEMEILLFRAVQELLLNVVKHAQARHVQIAMSRDGEYIRISVADDGVGFNLSQSKLKAGRASGFGLFSINKRLQSLHGYCTVDSKPDQGTQATLMALLQCAEDTLQVERV